MKYLYAVIATALFAGFIPRANALTNTDIAGVYQGTSVATLPTGATVSASVTLTLKPRGKMKIVAVTNGQTITSKGRYQFVGENAITETAPRSEALAFVDLNDSVLTFNILVRTDAGQIIREVTTVTLKNKL